MSEKPIPQPMWWKNTYFWFAAILLIVGIVGLPFLGGPNAIRDPGQREEGGLVLIYWGGALVMLINGFISHRQTVMHYQEQQDALRTATKPESREEETE
ncbi:MAG TPA: hypothetical protein PLH94_06855 [Fimbriimonadaceae bacterium]|nr:hypothetical protein [Fimbriimonadaceae bacterium]